MNPYWNIFQNGMVAFRQKRAILHCAALTYFALFALIPTLYLILISFGAFFGEQACLTAISAFFNDYMGIQDISVFTSFLDSADIHDSSWALNGIMIIVLLYSASSFITSLKHSLNVFFEVKKERPPRRIKVVLRALRFKLLSFAYLLAMIFIAFLFYLLELFLVGVEAMSDGVLSKLFFDERVVNALLFILTNGTLITIVFKWVNEAKIPWKLAIRGALFTSIVLYLFQFAINYYLKTYFFLSNVNLVGVVFVLMAWVYYSAHILYFGAIITYFYGIEFNFLQQKKIKE